MEKTLGECIFDGGLNGRKFRGTFSNYIVTSVNLHNGEVYISQRATDVKNPCGEISATTIVDAYNDTLIEEQQTPLRL